MDERPHESKFLKPLTDNEIIKLKNNGCFPYSKVPIQCKQVVVTPILYIRNTYLN